MNSLINKLLLFDHLNEQQVRLISRKIEKVHLEEDEYFAEPGYIQSGLAFVDKGELRYNYYNNKAENITSSLIGEGDFIAPASHLLLPIIPSDYLQAITKCALLVIRKSGMDELSATIPNWDNILRMVSQKAIIQRRSQSVRWSDN
jgi:CRP-like cAMP-binding protein